jgi:uncharacterized protein YyaL (SSP411 family)
MNHLQDQTSPYLLQHVQNPVDWYPWGEEAIQRSRLENKPIFLSIGYAACHWCHVMAHESFENPLIAEQLNSDFICIKIDREERPDLDQIYMTAVIALTGQGGWPLSAFLTPQLKPFYGGTYFPPIARYGLPSFAELLENISRVWQNQQEKVLESADHLTQQIQEHYSQSNSTTSEKLTKSAILDIAEKMLISYDWADGGWGNAPKFPAAMTIDFLLQAGKYEHTRFTDAAVHYLHSLSMGGIFDLVDGGFHRYSTDKTWTVPHFEKMLYDNAQLARNYIHAYQLTHNPHFRQVAEKTIDYILNHLTSPEGGFYSSQDADSDGTEGTYYLWSVDELQASQEIDLQKYQSNLDLPNRGHLDGQYLLKLSPQEKPQDLAYQDWIPYSIEILEPVLNRLSAIRKTRTPPATDDKIILSWNALALGALVEAGLAFDREDYLHAARQNAEFLHQNLYRDGFLHHTWRDGKGNQIGFLEDYAGFAIALLTLYQADSQSKWLTLAEDLISKMLTEFDSNGVFLFSNRKGEENLISPVLDLQDMVTPSGMALAAHALLLISAIQEKPEFSQQTEKWLVNMADSINQHPAAYAYWLQAALLLSTSWKNCVLVYPPESRQQAMSLIHSYYLTYHPDWLFIPYEVQPGDDSQLADILQDKLPKNGQPTLYVCENHTCQSPLYTNKEILDFFSKPSLNQMK